MQTPHATQSTDTPTLQLQKAEITYLVSANRAIVGETAVLYSEPEGEGDEALETARAKARQLRNWVANKTIPENEWLQVQPKLISFLDKAIKETSVEPIGNAIIKTKETVTKITNIIKKRKELESQKSTGGEEAEAVTGDEEFQLSAAHFQVQTLKDQIEEFQTQEPDYKEQLGKFFPTLDKLFEVKDAKAIQTQCKALEEKFHKVQVFIQKKHEEEKDQQPQDGEDLLLKSAHELVLKLQVQIKQFQEEVAKEEPESAEQVGKLFLFCDKLLTQSSAADVELKCNAVENKFLQIRDFVEKRREEEKDLGPEEKAFKRAWAKLRPVYLQAKALPKFNDGVAKAKKAMEVAYQVFAKPFAAKEFTKATEALGPLEKALAPFPAFKKQYDQEEQEFNDGFEKIRDRYVSAKAVPPATPGVQPLLPPMYGIINKILVAKTELRYAKATAMMSELEKALDAVLDQQALCEQGKAKFDLEWDKVTQKYDKALEMCPDSTPDIDRLRRELEDARKAVEDKAAVHDYVEATKLITACNVACKAFLVAATDVRKGPGAGYANERAQIRPDFEEALLTPAGSPEAIKLLDELSRLLTESDDVVYKKEFDKALELLKSIDEKAQALLVLKAQFENDRQAYDDKWGTIEKDTNQALRVRPATSELKTLLAEVQKVNEACLVEIEATHYAEARALLDDLEGAATLLLAAAAKYDETAGPKALETKEQIDKLDTDGLLDAQPVEEKLKLLEGLRGGATPLDEKGRETQRKLYKALRMDEDFKEDDKERRQQVVKNLLPDAKAKEELQKDKSGWAGKKDEEKLAVLRRMVAAQSEAFEIKPPPIVGFYEEAAGAGIRNGYFSPKDGMIHMNTHPACALHDFAAALDTVFHENSHNYQKQLSDRVAGEPALPKDDKRHLQARIFEANFAPGGYVKGAEEMETYLCQPLEDHAHVNGPKTAKALLKALQS